MKELLGGKGANLSEMSKMGLPVPAAFTITTEVCEYIYAHGEKYPSQLEKEVAKNMAKLEKATGKKFGDPKNPLLLSVRSGASVSMPGMMDTVLNLGLNEKTLAGLIDKTGNERFCYDIFRRFINMFGNVVLGVDHHHFEAVLDRIKKKIKVKEDTELTAKDWKEVSKKYLELVKRKTGKAFPMQPKKQLQMAIDAVFGSWMNARAISYRRINKLQHVKGTAVNVQAMVFGNTGEHSGTGVLFTRDPGTGENKLYGEYLVNAQGEDVVAGIRTPEDMKTLAKKHPEIYEDLLRIKKLVEKHYKEMQDMEFTVEEGKLYVLQTRTGKRTAQAAIRIAMEMLKEKLVNEKQAVMMVNADMIDQVLHPFIDPKAPKEEIAKGLPASPGAATGKVVFSSETAAHRGEKEDIILVRHETSPEDIEGMNAAKGILTSCGGMTSHAAVVARGMGKPCIAGASEVCVDYANKLFTVDGQTFRQNDVITIDGSAGCVYKGYVKRVDPKMTADFEKLMKLADKYRTLKVRANVDTGPDAEKARALGAEGIGLCRTEHMFFQGHRLRHMQGMIVAHTVEERKRELAKLLPYQKRDFESIFTAMKGLPVTIRLLDPPLHEFLPGDSKGIAALAKSAKMSKQKLKKHIEKLHEINPMLGHRGCRLLISYPEIAEMQTKAIISAALAVQKKKMKVYPEIEIPLIGTIKELTNLTEVIHATAKKVDPKGLVKYKVGTMIEVARACTQADKIAESAEFASFGTNDLTQTTFGFSRDDAGKFLPDYVEHGILPADPFQTLDKEGVGEFVEMAVSRARKVDPKFELGVCGEHGGDPDSITFFHNVGLDLISCSTYRVPVARLAAAQAALGKK